MLTNGLSKGTLAESGIPILPAFDQQMRATLALLEQAPLARDAECDAWTFAVDVAQLRGYGVPDILLKWMIVRGYVKHRRQVAQILVNGAGPLESVEIGEGSVFTLTLEGERLARQVTTATGKSVFLTPFSPGPNVSETGPRLHESLDRRGQTCVKPQWDVVCKRLWYADQLVKQFKLPSANQETVLMAFEEEGWPQRVDDPLPQQPNQNPHVRLGNTIKALNRNQKHKLLQFRGDGSGEGVLWEPFLGSTDNG